jgi:hypothetical protein
LFHKSGHLFLIPHALSLCPILINHAKNCYLLPLSLQKECFECSQHTSQACTKNMYNLKNNTRLLLLLSIATMLAEIQSENKQKQEVRSRQNY